MEVGLPPGRAWAPPRAKPRGTRRNIVGAGWTAFAQVLLEVAQPSGDIPAQLAFGNEPEARRRMLANPRGVHELAHEPA
jgi:hypothetical protein